uniref:DNA-directed RNA polymerase subunit n=1 Tax=Euglena viridis TaxID=3040 RepID=A0A0G3VIR5_EUGVI|nr:RNA polymerase beta' subunit [Euglena viridis]
MKEYIKINIASPQKILNWTERPLPNGELIGEITKPETVDHETFKPITEGLFCEKIFGPIKDFECCCKKYKRIQKKFNQYIQINICPKCKVQITNSKIRNYRMGYINLSNPTIHLWYLKNTPNYLANTLNKSIQETNKLVYNKSYIVTGEKKKEKYITGGEALNSLLKNFNLEKTYEFNFISTILNKKKIESENEKIKKKLKVYQKRLKIINNFMQTKSKPSWMLIKYLPVLPPNIRPIVKLQDKTIITTDLNFLYGNIININNKIIKLRKMSVPENFLNNEKYMLQDKVDKLISTEKNTNLKSINKKKLKPLSSNIQGKKGRFRENLLGKTVDYSGRSVIVVEPKLKLNECGIPKEIEIELFQPFIIKKMFQLKLINTIREGKEKINLGKKNILINEILKRIMNKHFILLNRAPTLHRIGIQAFKPILNNEKAIQLHPLVCAAFNADFDGDQMGIHIPLTLKAQSEAQTLMISSNNCTSPATGQSNISPSQDMILGCYFLTIENGSLKYLLNKIKCYTNIMSILTDYKNKKLLIHNYVWVYTNKITNKININKNKKNVKKIMFLRTTVGRVLFNYSIAEFL